MAPVRYRTTSVDDFKVFYREAGPPGAQKLLLLHGFPSASHMFRDLLPLLADRFHMVAPDLPGFGQSEMPLREKFRYTFDNIASVIGRFTEVIGFDRFSVYVFDYGAPTGFRLAVRHPERITAIISQNGNAYEEGLSDGWSPIRTYWEDPSQANRNALRAFLTPETTRWQYTIVAEEVELDFISAGTGQVKVVQVLTVRRHHCRVGHAVRLRTLSAEEMAQYRRPFAEPGEGRRPTLTWPREIPVEGSPPTWSRS